MKSSKTSPTGGKRACLCKDATYKAECCKGDLINQGVGALEGGHVVNKTQIIITRNIQNP